MKRRTFLTGSLAAGLSSTPVLAQRHKYGLVLLHAKLDQVEGYLQPLANLARERGHESETPNLPWSRSRYLSANWEGALSQVTQAVNALRVRGARRVVLVGHGIGALLAMSYFTGTHSARHGIIHALVAIAPGHVPEDYFTKEPAVRESVNRAREMMAAGNGMTVARFFDSDDGRPLAATLSAVSYLSFLDPEGQAVITKFASKVTLPVLWISNGQDQAYPALMAAKEAMQVGSRNTLHYPGIMTSDLPAQAAPAISRWLEGF